MSLPTELTELFNGDHVDDACGETFLLATVDEEHLPHLAMLGIGEVYAPSPTRINLALHRGTGSRRALSVSRHGLLSVVRGGAAHQIRLHVRSEHLGDSDGITCFTTEVVEARQDRAAYATLVSGVTFELRGDLDQTLARWHRQVEHLKLL
ncbi:hypothetical protein [Nocardioides daejeonensis]|uniref:hypothetical protein n=1 Tax=Nocardioides daejeonensis TaxID=1046556 RepID=UPI000D7497A6|nr:hypothetical protein [Nocardioides daejeonensis]